MQKGKYLLALLVPIFLFGRGAQLVELGTPALGVAGVGQAAEATNASISYYNPAGMPLLSFDEVLVGGQLGAVWGAIDTCVVPGVGAYWVHHFSDWASFGFSLNAPYLIHAKYSPSFLDSGEMSLDFCAVDFNPSVGFRLTEWMSIGGGLVLEGMASQTLVVIDEIDLYWRSRSVDWRVGYNLGILFSIGSQTRLGFAYRSELSKRVSKKKDYSMYNGMRIFEGHLPFPQNLTASLYHLLTPRLALLFDVGFAQYKIYNSIVGMNNFVGAVKMGHHFKDVWHGGFGVQYAVYPGWTVQSGVMYGDTPVLEKTIELPVGAQLRWGAGLIYDVGACSFSSNVEYAKTKNVHALFLNFTFAKRF